MKILKICCHLIPFWKTEFCILFSSLISMALALWLPYLGKLVVDGMSVNGDVASFIVLSIAAGLAFIFGGLFESWGQYLNRYLRTRLSFDLDRRLFKKMQALPYGFFRSLSTGEYLYHVTHDVERVSTLITNILPTVLVLIPKAVFILAILFYLNAKIALMALILAPFLYVVPYFLNKKVRLVFGEWVNDSQDVFTRLQEGLGHIYWLKACGLERRESADYIKLLARNVRVSLRNVRVEVAGSFFNSLANHLVLGLIVLYGCYHVFQGQLTLGSLGAIVVYLGQLSIIQQSFANFLLEITQGQVSYDRLEKILNSSKVILELPDARDIVIEKGSVVFRDVSFGYGTRRVLRNAGFEIKGGSCVGLVGPSGCGKTTIINLILRLYSPEAGSIFVDGHDVRAMRSKGFYQQIGVALQEPYLWNDSIRNNILYSGSSARIEDMYAAARVAGVDDFIATVQDGYQAVIGENACRISEGQKQRIALARAIIHRPKILILDEALSSVEPQKEAMIIQQLRDFLKGSTIIIVSHRIATIEKMDRVYLLLDSGTVESVDRADMACHAAYRKYSSGELIN